MKRKVMILVAMVAFLCLVPICLFADGTSFSFGIIWNFTILAPSTYSSSNTEINVGSSVGSSLYRYITTFWIDLALCMDELDSDSLKHIDVNDDYYSTVILKWESTFLTMEQSWRTQTMPIQESMRRIFTIT